MKIRRCMNIITWRAQVLICRKGIDSSALREWMPRSRYSATIASGEGDSVKGVMDAVGFRELAEKVLPAKRPGQATKHRTSQSGYGAGYFILKYFRLRFFNHAIKNKAQCIWALLHKSTHEQSAPGPSPVLCHGITFGHAKARHFVKRSYA